MYKGTCAIQTHAVQRSILLKNLGVGHIAFLMGWVFQVHAHVRAQRVSVSSELFKMFSSPEAGSDYVLFFWQGFTSYCYFIRKHIMPGCVSF